MAFYAGLSESQLSPLQRGQQGHQVLSKLELLKNEYQERVLQEKEHKMLKLLTQQPQVGISRRINGYRTLQPPEEKTWASNWTVAKKTAGVDRAHPLKPLYSYNESTVHRFPSANIAGAKHPLPYVRSKSGPSCTERWRELEKSEMNLKADIRRKETLLHKKLRRTEEELRRIQKEKEEAEQEESRAQEIPDVQTRPRRTRLKKGNIGGSVKATKDSPLPIEQYSGGIVKAMKDSPLPIEQYSGGIMKATKDSPLPIEQYSGGSVKATKDSPLPIEQYSGGIGKARSESPLSIDLYRRGAVKAGKDSRLSSGQCSEGSVQDSLLSIGDQHYRGHRGMVCSVPQDTSLTQVVDSIHQLKLEASGVQDSGHPSSEHLEEASLDSNIPQSLGQQLVPCQLCGRCFMEHRLQRHIAVCEKTHSSRRKVFDSSKARAKGTDLEQYLHNKGRQPLAAPQQARPNLWRQKHESFMRSIRQARVVEHVVARGGRISDLPPAPPEENPGYVACPHCSRRFEPRAAERHIPKCETIKSRPRPPPSRRR